MMNIIEHARELARLEKKPEVRAKIAQLAQSNGMRLDTLYKDRKINKELVDVKSIITLAKELEILEKKPEVRAKIAQLAHSNDMRLDKLSKGQKKK